MKIDDFINEIEMHPLTTAIAIFIILFVVVRMKQSNTNTSTTAITSDNPVHPQVAEVYYQTYNSNPVTPVSPVTPVTSSGTPGFIRAKTNSGPYAGYDKNNTGVPYYASPTTTAVGTIPYGTSISIIKNGIKGVNHSNGGNYTQISWLGGTEYVASQDIA